MWQGLYAFSLQPSALDLASICLDEKDLLGSYSSDFTLQDEVARLVFSRQLDVRPLISHRFPLEQTSDAVPLRADPPKIPSRSWFVRITTDPCYRFSPLSSLAPLRDGGSTPWRAECPAPRGEGSLNLQLHPECARSRSTRDSSEFIGVRGSNSQPAFPHRFPLEQTAAAVQLAGRPTEDSLKILVENGARNR